MINKVFKLRDYQKEFRDAIRAAFDGESRRVMAQLPTGGGKTVVFNDFVNAEKESNSRVLIIAHREELIFQAAEKYARGFGEVPGIIKSKTKPNLSARVQVASVQTVASWFKRLEKESKGNFGLKSWDIKFDQWKKDFRKLLSEVSLIVIDEAHLAKAPSYKAILERCPESRVLGFTATPYRLSGEGFRELFDTLIVGTEIQNLEERGFLQSAKVFINPIGSDLLSDIKKSGGDYDEKELSELMSSAKITADAVSAYFRRAEGMSGIVFCVNVEHSKKVTADYIAAGVPAKHIDGKTPKEERAKAFRELSSGVIKILVNVEVATTGFDEPKIQFVQMLRPTKSLSLYLQMAGRGSRPNDTGNTYILLDHANNIIEHGSPNKKRNWKSHFNGRPRRKKKKKEAEIENLVLDLDSGRLHTPTNIPHGINLGLIEISENIRVDEISKSVKDGRKKKKLNSEIASDFVSSLLSYPKGQKKPTFEELLIVAALTGGTKRQAKIWANRYGAIFPIEQERLPKPKTFSGIQKMALCIAVKERSSISEFNDDSVKICSTRNPRTISSDSASILFETVVDNMEIFDNKTLVDCGVISEF